jgi:hypothetical protein
MVDYRKRLVDMTPEEKAEVAPAADNFSKVFGDRTEEPMSVTAADTAVSLATPVDSVVEVQKELQKEEPDYLKIGMLAGVEALGSIPALGPVAKSMIRKGADLSKQTDTAIEGATNIPVVSRVNQDVSDAEKLLDDPSALKSWQEENKLPETKRQANPVDSQAAAQELFEGNITSKEARKKIADSIPEPKEFTAEEVMEMMPTVTEVTGSLGKKAGKFGILGVKGFGLEAGQKVSSRLDIPAYNNYDTWVVSIHDGTKDAGSVVGFGQAIRLKGIRFGSKSKEALDIARGKRRTPAGEDKPMGKSTIARVFGEYVPEDPYELQKQAADIIASGSDEWTQVGMNPYRGSAFYDKKTGMPVFEADGVIQVGPLVLAKNVKKPTISQMKEMAVKTADGKIRMFNEGGMAMNEQMEMAFALGGSVEEVDPVSGNEVPTGSLPEEVRDNIDARLSEGEYVVPADVVRFFGVKFFEDLRTQAKMGFADMEANGRIGGEPVPAEGGLPFDVSELQAEDIQDEPMMMNEGGDVTTMTQPDFMQGYTLPSAGQTQEYKTYVNEQGLTMTIRFVNGQPTVAIPAGYTEVGKEQPAATTPTSDRDREADRPIEVSKRDIPDYSSIPEGKEEADSWFSSVQKEIMGAKSLGGASVPVIGLAQVAHRKDIGKKLDALLKREDVTEVNKTKVQTLLDQLNGENEPDFLGGLTNMADSIKSGVSTAADNFRNRAGMFYDPLEDVSDTALRDYGKVDEQGNKQLQTKEERQKDKDQSLSNAMTRGGTDAFHKQASENYRADMEAAGYTATPTGFVKEDKEEENTDGAPV